MSQKPLVLIAEDQPHIQLALEYLVRTAGEVRIESACEGGEAIHLAARQLPRLVIIGEHLPPIEPCAAACIIRNQWGDHDGVLWLSAGKLSPLDHESACNAGFDQIITNPFDPNFVIDEVRKAIGAADQTRNNRV